MSQPVQLLTSRGQVITVQTMPMEQHHYGEINTIWKLILVATKQPDAGWIWDYKLHQSQREEPAKHVLSTLQAFHKGSFLSKRSGTVLTGHSDRR